MKEGNEDKAPRTIRGWIALIIPSILGIIGILCTCWSNWSIQKSKEEHDADMHELEYAVEQKLYIQENIINRAGIEYVQCEITAEPHMAGYHVRPYAYVVYDTEKDSSYIPIEGLFSQEEYVADQEGTCTIWYENTMAELQKKLEDIAAEKRGESSKAIIRVDCAVAIQYIESKERQTDLYELRSGELIPIGEEETIRIKRIWEAEDSVKIDMLSWPALDITMLDKIIT